MNEIAVLVEGYARETGNGWIASSAATLVKSNGKKIVVDPGCSRKKLMSALMNEGLKKEDIDFVLLTHGHTDHALLSGIFERAKVLTAEEIYESDRQEEHNNRIPGTDLEIIQTPGHCREHCSLVVPTPKGTYVIAGDVFWWTDGEKQAPDVRKEDSAHPEEVDMKKLMESRKRILRIADYVIPGHGKAFKVPK